MSTENRGVNPLKDSMNPQAAPPKAYFGRFEFSGKYIKLVTGVGRVDFVEGVDKPRVRQTLVTFKLHVLPGRDRPGYTITRDMISEGFNQDIGWVNITLPSLLKLDTDAETLNGLYGMIYMPESGDSYEKEQFDERGKSLGWKTVMKTVPQIVAVFPNEAACAAGEQVYYGNEPDGAPEPTTPKQASGNGSPIGASPFAAKEQAGDERAAAATMLPTLWLASGNNAEMFYQFIAGSEALKKYFTPESDEVKAIVNGKSGGVVTEPLPDPRKPPAKPGRRNVPQPVEADEDLPF